MSDSAAKAVKEGSDGDRGNAEEHEKKWKERKQEKKIAPRAKDGRERTFFLRFQTYYYSTVGIYSLVVRGCYMAVRHR